MSGIGGVRDGGRRDLPPSANPVVHALRAAARAVAVVSACFCLVVGLRMMFAQARMVKADVLNDPVLIELRRQFAADPDNERLKRDIRAADLRNRRLYFTHQERARVGALLLLYASLALLASLAALPLLSEAMPDLGELETQPSEWTRRRAVQRGLAAGLFALAAVAALSARLLRGDPERGESVALTASETLSAPSFSPLPSSPGGASSHE
jgi:hypothetical protein